MHRFAPFYLIAGATGFIVLVLFLAQSRAAHGAFPATPVFEAYSTISSQL
jgi:hypothetical protein